MTTSSNPFAPPKADLSAPVVPPGGFYALQAGPLLVVAKGAPLPDICMKCGTKEDLTRKLRTFMYTPPWVYFLVFINLLVCMIVALIVRKTGKLSVPLCRDCASRWTWAAVSWGLSIVWLIFGSVFAIMFMVSDLHPAVGLFILVTAIGAPIAANYVLLRPRTIISPKVTNEHIHLRGVDPEATIAVLRASGITPVPGAVLRG
jgi:hypothetical protein